MKAKSKEYLKLKKRNALLFIIMIILILFVALLSYVGSIEKTFKDYYKDQMINFCKIAEFYNSEDYPELYPCEKWIMRAPWKM